MKTGWQIDLTDEERSRLLSVGYWRSREQPELPDPAAYVDTAWGEEERGAALSYLRSAPSCMRFCGYSTCRICGQSGPELGDSDLTDGTWIWPQGLVHYLEQHALRPPEPFLAHLRNRRFHLTTPLLPPETTLARLDPRLLRGMVRSEDERTVRLQLARPATKKDLYQGVEIDRALGCFRFEVNEAALRAERQRTERLLNPPAWRRALRAILGL